ncbi:MAG: hypothetical protein ABFC67_15205 [Mizugakiibacter sp.]|uniref:hypothetical protein n=1 Tax=Mizugakiibacter sp. TaxID=1972610 RepID=UPI0031C4CFF9|nr:hypothetical protein [Xanthomonadaceae bacterium]
MSDARDKSGLQQVQRQALPVHYAALSAALGLLAFPAVHGYFLWTLIPAAIAAVAYRMMARASRKRFLALMCANFLVGCVVRFLPNASNEGVGGLRLLLVPVCVLIDGGLLWCLFKSEVARRLGVDGGDTGRAEQTAELTP